MSVAKVMEDVNIHVPTLLVAIAVHVILVIFKCLMENIALVIITWVWFAIYFVFQISMSAQQTKEGAAKLVLILLVVIIVSVGMDIH